jgi:hypothetical protein
MSAYQMVVRSLHRGIDLAVMKHRFFRWWVSLYAEPPRKLPPMI